MTTAPRPPRLAEALAECLIADAALRDAALGDLAEDFTVRAEANGHAAARAWYWSQVVRSAPSLAAFGTTAARGLSRAALTWLRFVASVVLGYAVLAALVGLLDIWMMGLLRDPAGIPWLMPVWSLVSGAASAVVAGYVGALIGGHARILPASHSAPCASRSAP